MKTFSIILSLAVLSSCAQLNNTISQITPGGSSKQSEVSNEPFERSVEYVVETDLKASEAYKKANHWLAKRLNNSKMAIQVQDDQDFLLASKMSTTCNTFNSAIDMDFEFQAKDKKIRVVYENITARSTGNMFEGLVARYPSSHGQLDDFKRTCLDPMVENLKSSLAKKEDW